MFTNKKNTYIGQTSDLPTRITKHKYRYYGGDGSHYYVYQTFRMITETFEDIKFQVIKSFATKAEANNFEKKMIRKEGTLNTQLRI